MALVSSPQSPLPPGVLDSLAPLTCVCAWPLEDLEFETLVSCISLRKILLVQKLHQWAGWGWPLLLLVGGKGTWLFIILSFLLSSSPLPSILFSFLPSLFTLPLLPSRLSARL